MKRSTWRPTVPGHDEQAMAERSQRSRRHAVDRSLVDPYHAVVRTRQATKRASEPERRGSGDDAERRIALPRCVALAATARRTRPSSSGRGARLPSLRPARQPRAGAPSRTAEATRSSGCRFKRLEDQHATEAMPDEMCSAALDRLARKARQARDVAFQRTAPPVGEDVGCVARARQASGEEGHRGAGHPQTWCEHHVARHYCFSEFLAVSSRATPTHRGTIPNSA